MKINAIRVQPIPKLNKDKNKQNFKEFAMKNQRGGKR